MIIQNIVSPNFLQGRKQYRPEAIVIHVMEGTLTGTDSWFANRRSSVSAHYGVGKRGDVHAYVSENDTAWHAGRVNKPSWPGIKSAGRGMFINPNFYTIGIEHEGNEHSDWTEAMYVSSAALIKDICTRWSIPIDRKHIVGHHEIYSLKTCPGFKADINRLILLAGGSTDTSAIVVPAGFTKVAETGKVTTISRLNLRSQPDTTLKPINTIEKNIQLAYDGFTENGQILNGNGKWYYTNEGSWFWSGAVSSAPVAPLRIVEAPIAIGGITVLQLAAGAGAKTEYAQKFLPYIADTCTQYDISTPARRICFFSQVGHESGGLFYTEELASGRAYENRKDLGNIQEGDGIRFKGRGLIQITGRANYESLTHSLHEDFINHPEWLGGKNVTSCDDQQMKYAVLSAGWFWNTRKLNSIADEIDISLPIDVGNNLSQFKLLTKRINGGYNGLQDRVQRFKAGVEAFR